MNKISSASGEFVACSKLSDSGERRELWKASEKTHGDFLSIFPHFSRSLFSAPGVALLFAPFPTIWNRLPSSPLGVRPREMSHFENGAKYGGIYRRSKGICCPNRFQMNQK